MPTIYVLSGLEIGRTHEAGEGAVFGRSPDCEVTLRATSVSRRHARLEREGEQWVIVDLDSSNGVRFEGKRVSRLELLEGMLFTLGDLELRFRTTVEAEEAPPRPSAEPSPPVPPPPPSGLEPPTDPEEIVLEGTEFLEADRTLPQAMEKTDIRPSPVTDAARARREAAREKEAARGSMLSGAKVQGLAGEADVRDTSRAPLRFSRHAEHGGFFSADLAQYPLWVRLFAGLLALVLFVGLFYVAFRGAGFLRERATGEVPVEESP